MTGETELRAKIAAEIEAAGNDESDQPFTTAARRPLRVNGKPIPPEIANGSPGDFARFCGETDPAVLAILDAEADDE